MDDILSDPFFEEWVEEIDDLRRLLVVSDENRYDEPDYMDRMVRQYYKLQYDPEADYLYSDSESSSGEAYFSEDDVCDSCGAEIGDFYSDILIQDEDDVSEFPPIATEKRRKHHQLRMLEKLESLILPMLNLLKARYRGEFRLRNNLRMLATKISRKMNHLKTNQNHVDEETVLTVQL